MNNLVLPTRAWRFLKKDAVESYRTILIVIGAVSAVVLLNFFLNEISQAVSGHGATSLRTRAADPASVHLIYFALALFIGGYVISSRAFVELHTKARNIDWFMLPASLPEKYIVRLLTTTVIFSLGAVVWYFVVSLLVSGVVKLISGAYYPLFNPFDRRVWLLVANYLVTQSLFLAGAVYFRRSHFIKTVLVTCGFAILVTIVLAVSARIAFGPYIGGTLSVDAGGFLGAAWDEMRARLTSTMTTLTTIARIVYWGLVAPILWIFAYVRLAETEVRNGV